MKTKILPFLLLSVFTHAFAAEEKFTVDENKRLIGVMMDDYATIAGGWYLEKKCHFLSEELLKEYEGCILIVTVGMHSVLGVDKKIIYQMQEAGKKTAEDDKWKCDDTGRYIVVSTVAKVRKLGDALAAIDKAKQEKAKQSSQ